MQSCLAAQSRMSQGTQVAIQSVHKRDTIFWLWTLASISGSLEII